MSQYRFAGLCAALAIALAGPKAIGDANALIAKAQSLSTELAKYNVTLTVPSVPGPKPSTLR